MIRSMSFLHGQGLHHKYYFYDAQMKTCHINNGKKKKIIVYGTANWTWQRKKKIIVWVRAWARAQRLVTYYDIDIAFTCYVIKLWLDQCHFYMDKDYITNTTIFMTHKWKHAILTMEKKKLLSMEQQIEPDKTNLPRFQIIWSFW